MKSHWSLVICHLFFALAAASAQIKISELPSATTLGGTEVVAGVQSGSTRKITIAQIRAGLVHTGSTYSDPSWISSLEWSKVASKPDPTITAAGDATGTVTLTDVQSGTISLTLSTTQAGAHTWSGSNNFTGTLLISGTDVLTLLDSKVDESGGTASGLTLTGLTQVSGTIAINALAISGTALGANSNVIRVSKSVQSSDTRTGLSKYDATRPFLTITAAKAVAAAGDTIIVSSGTYAENDILKNGVDQFHEAGVVVTWSGTGRGIFDDSDGTISCVVSGAGKYIATAEATALIWMQSGSSNIKISGSELVFSTTTNEQSALCHTGTTTQKLFLDFTIIRNTKGSTFEQLGGQIYASAKQILVESGYFINASEPDDTSNIYVTGDLIKTGLVDPVNLYAGYGVGKTWISAKEVQGDVYLSGAYTGKFYLTAQKWHSPLFDKLVWWDNGAAGEVWINAQKVTIPDLTTAITGDAGAWKAWITIGHVERIGAGVLCSSSGGETYLTVQDSYAQIRASGGLLKFEGRINMTGAADYPVIISGGTVILNNSTLISDEGSESISASTPQSVTVTEVFANQAFDPDITPKGGTITISSDIQ